MVKDLGLMFFMVGIGLSAGGNMFEHLTQVGPQVIGLSLIVSVVPVMLAYLVGAYVLKMNRAMYVRCHYWSKNVCASNGCR